MLGKFHSYLFLCLLVCQTMGFSAYFAFEKAKIRKQLKTCLKQGVPKDKLHSFVFSASALEKLHWVKKKEFKLGERFFDVVWKKKDAKGFFRLQCVDDQQETRLFKNLASFVYRNLGDQQSNHPLHTVFELFSQPYVAEPLNIQICEVILPFNKALYAFNAVLPGCEIEIPSPPPNLRLTI